MLTSTTKMIGTEIIPLFTGAIAAGISWKIIKIAADVIAEGRPFREFYAKTQKLIYADILAIVITAWLSTVKGYFK